eukprot:g22984.t1
MEGHHHMMMPMSTVVPDQFCTGIGTVMQNGFGWQRGGPCLLFLFEGLLLDTANKYRFALLAAACMGAGTELLLLFRARFDHITHNRAFLSWRELRARQAASSVLFGIQMLLAYFCMLLVMSFDLCLLLSLLLGYIVGHALCRPSNHLHRPKSIDSDETIGLLSAMAPAGVARRNAADHEKGSPSKPGSFQLANNGPAGSAAGGGTSGAMLQSQPPCCGGNEYDVENDTELPAAVRHNM